MIKIMNISLKFNPCIVMINYIYSDELKANTKIDMYVHSNFRDENSIISNFYLQFNLIVYNLKSDKQFIVQEMINFFEFFIAIIDNLLNFDNYIIKC